MREAERQTAPLRELGKALQVASAQCANEMKRWITDDAEKIQRESLVYFEFVYFFMHITNRVAFRILGHERRTKLQEELGPAMVHAVVESLCGHWPGEMKERIKHEFFEKMNDAEVEYSACPLQSSDNPLGSNALFPLLARHVADLAGSPDNPEVILDALYVARTALAATDLDRLVGEIKRLL